MRLFSMFCAVALLLCVLPDSEAGVFRHRCENRTRLVVRTRIVTRSTGCAACETPTPTPAEKLPALKKKKVIEEFGVLFVDNEPTDALDEVNARRIERGLQPLVKDDGLTIAALNTAKHRATYRIAGHVDDFAFVPQGSSADAAGCAALSSSWGWQSCCWDGNYTHAGAAYAVGADGLRYMHIFVRGGFGNDAGKTYNSSTRIRFRRR